MFSQVYYLLRSKIDGQYLAARPRADAADSPPSGQTGGFLMLFAADHEALSYLNTHGPDVADRFALESVSGARLGGLMDRWGFEGVGIVKDPLIPQVDFLRRAPSDETLR
ncbi:MAG: hypothetical protein QNJ46_19805 [Leptolyngbyaceae cyanobacterium MO_188.B28]|nr:hypothetical protein [Leptolyngbyaceae cyanobacterium MO_188.B28]